MAFSTYIRLLGCCCSLAAWIACCGLRCSYAQDDWEVLRVYVQDKQQYIDQLVTDDYYLESIEVLSAKLKQEAQRRSANAFPNNGLKASMAVAKLVGDRIVSDQALWVLDSQGDANPSNEALKLGRLNVSVSRVRELPVGTIQLSDEDLYDAEGNLLLGSRPEGAVYAFGFTSLGTRRERQLTWQLEFPPASVGELLLSLPPDQVLTSSTAVVQRVTPEQVAAKMSLFSDSGWENQLNGVDPGAQWWLVNHSGLPSYTLSATKVSRQSQGFSIVASRVRHKYSVFETRGTLQLEADLSASPSGTDLFLDVPNSILITGLRLRDVSVAFQSEASELEGHTRLRISVDAMPVDSTLDVTGVFNFNLTDYETTQPQALPELPVVQLAGVFALDGQTTIQANDSLVILDIEAKYASAPAINQGDAVEADALEKTVDVTGGLQVTQRSASGVAVRWVRTCPDIGVRLAKAAPEWSLETMTQVSLQSEWLSAQMNATVRGERIAQNEVKCLLGQGWFVDSVEIRGLANTSSTGVEASGSPAAVGINPQYRQLPESEGAGLRIWWEGVRKDVEFEVKLLAHRPLPPNQSRVSLQADQLLTLPGAKQRNLFAVSDAGSYNLMLDNMLVERQVAPKDLPDWARKYIDSGEYAWLIEGADDRIPNIRFERTEASFTANSITMVNSDAKNFETRFRLESLSGSLDSVKVVLPAGIDADAVRWSLLSMNGGEVLSGMGEIETQVRSDGSILVDLALPNIDGVLILVVSAECLTTESGDDVFFVPGLVGPVSNTARIILPRTARLVNYETAVELPAASEQRTMADLAQKFGLNDFAPEQQMIRIESAAARRFSYRQILPATSPAFAHTLRSTYRLYEQASGSGSAQWNLEVLADCDVTVDVPAGCTVTRVLVNDQAVRQFSEGALLEAEFSLPLIAGANQSISIEYQYQANEFLGFRKFVMTEPALRLSVAERTRQVELPPSRLTVGEMFGPRMVGTLWDRIAPNSLWLLFHPSAFQRVGNENGWRQIPVAFSETVTTVDATFVACLNLACMLSIVALLRIIGPKNHMGWCICISISTSATVLCPIDLLGVSQLLLMSFLLAYLLFMSVPVLSYRTGKRRSASKDRKPAASGRFPGPGTVGGLFLAMALSYSTVPQAWSQVPIGNSNVRPATQDKDSARKIYGVFIPVDENMEVSGEYAYVPTELLRKLNDDASAGTRETPIRIASADYQLKVRSAALSDSTQTVSLSVDLVIQSPSPMSVLELAFDASELILERAAIDGSEDTFGTNVEQEVTSGTVSIRPMASGRHNVRLEFAPATLVADARRYRFRAAVPPVACATLRIVAESQNDFEIVSNGVVQRSMASTFARIGAVDDLLVTWSQRQRSALDWNTNNLAESWLHVRGDSLLCAASVTLGDTFRPGDEVRIAMDPNWIPLGSNWGDATLIRATSVGLGIQMVYTLQVQQTRAAAPVIHTLLAPRDAQPNGNLRIPFLLPSGEATVERRLFWSADGSADWRIEGVAGWEVLRREAGASAVESPEAEMVDRQMDAPALSWAVNLLGTMPTMLLDGGNSTASPQLRRAAGNRALRRVFVREQTTVRLADDEFRVSFQADYSYPSDDASRLCQIRCGANLQIEEIKIDDARVEYVSVQLGNDRVISISPERGNVLDENLADSFRLTVELKAATRLGVATPLPRMVTLSTETLSSGYRVLASPEITCELASSNIAFETLDLTTDELLQELRVGVAAFEFDGNYRDSSTLPATFRLRRSPEIRTLDVSTRLVDSDGQWRAELNAKWPALEQPRRLVMLQVPSAIQKSIGLGGLTGRFLPTGDPGRMILCLAVDMGRLGTSASDPTQAAVPEISLQFPIDWNESARTVQLPDVRFLDMPVSSNQLALPKKVAGEPVQWLGVGKLLGHPTAEYSAFEPLAGNQRLSWRIATPPKNLAKVLLKDIRIDSLTETQVLGNVRFVVQPNGQFAFQVNTPASCQIFGARVNGIPVEMVREDEDAASFEVILRPNYLPCIVELAVGWERAGNDGRVQISLPKTESADASTQRIVAVSTNLMTLQQPLQPELTELSQLTPDGWRNQVSVAWLRCVDAATDKLERVSDDEISAWLSLFSPEAFGSKDSKVAIPSSLNGSASADLGISTSEAWGQLCERLGTLPPAQLEQGNNKDDSRYNSFYVFTGQANSNEIQIELTREFDGPIGRTRQITAAGLLLLLGALSVLIARRFGSTILGRMQLHTWMYWGYLTLLLYILLPTQLPAIVFALLTLLVLATELLSRIRRGSSVPQRI